MNSGDIKETNAVVDNNVINSISQVGDDIKAFSGLEGKDVVNCERNDGAVEQMNFESCNLEDFDIIDEVDSDTISSNLQETTCKSDVTSTTSGNKGASKLDKSLKSRLGLIPSETKIQIKSGPSILVSTDKSNVPKRLKTSINRANESPDKKISTRPQKEEQSRKGSVFTRISYSSLPNDSTSHTLKKPFERYLPTRPLRERPVDDYQDVIDDSKFSDSIRKEDCQHEHITYDSKMLISTCKNQAKAFIESDVDVKMLPLEKNVELELFRLQLYEKAKLIYMNELQNILKLHKNRRQSNIVIVTDERSNIDLSIFGKTVSIAVIPGLKFSKSFSAIKLLPNFGKGTVFIFVCGTHDLLLSVPSQSCINCEDCKEALNLLKLSSYSGDNQLIIKRVLQLNTEILNSTNNDIALFCGLFPVNINQENDVCYRNRKCQTKHDVEQLQFVEATIYEKYYDSIYCFNKFVNDHAEALGYKLWNLDNFKLFEQIHHQYQLIEGLYSVCIFEQKNVEKEIKIKCKELLISLCRPLYPEILTIVKVGNADDIVKLTGNVEADLNQIVIAKKERTQSNIVILSDDRDLFDAYLTGFDARISVVKKKHLNFENAFSSMQLHSKFGKGTIFVISCGTHDLLQCSPALDCISFDCPHPVIEFSFNSFSINLITETFKLNVKLLNSTTNDIVIFSELFPVDINQYHKYQSRQCNHPLNSLPVITDKEFKKYIYDIQLYNSFVKYHAQSLSFMPWDLVSPFSIEDLSRILIVDGYNIRESEGLRRGDVAKFRCRDLIRCLTLVRSKFKDINTVKTSHADIKEIFDENHGKVTKYERIVFVTDRLCMPYIKHFRNCKISFLILDYGLAIEDLGKYMSESQNILTQKTLYFLVIGIHYVTKAESSSVCLSNKCLNPLQTTIDNDFASKGQVGYIKQLTKSLHDSFTMAKRYLPQSSNMAILPALPVSFFSLISDHERMHKLSELFPDYLICDPKRVTTYGKWVPFLASMSVSSMNSCIEKNFSELVKRISTISSLKEMKGLSDENPNYESWKEGIQEIINGAFKTLIFDKLKNTDIDKRVTQVSMLQATPKKISQQIDPLLYPKRDADILPANPNQLIIETMMIPGCGIGRIIGKNAETIKKLSRISGTEMYIPQDNKQNLERPLVISGELCKVEMAKKLVKNRLSEVGIDLALWGCGKQPDNIYNEKHMLGSQSKGKTSQGEISFLEERLSRGMAKIEEGIQQGIHMDGGCCSESDTMDKELGIPNAPPGMSISTKLMKALNEDYDRCDYSYPIIQGLPDTKNSLYPQSSNLRDQYLNSGSTSKYSGDYYTEAYSYSYPIIQGSHVTKNSLYPQSSNLRDQYLNSGSTSKYRGDYLTEAYSYSYPTIQGSHDTKNSLYPQSSNLRDQYLNFGPNSKYSGDYLTEAYSYSYPIIQGSHDTKNSYYPQNSNLREEYPCSGSTSNKNFEPLSHSLMLKSKSPAQSIESRKRPGQCDRSSQLVPSRHKRSNDFIAEMSRYTAPNVRPGSQSRSSNNYRSRSRSSKHGSVSQRHNRTRSRSNSANQTRRRRSSSLCYNKRSKSKSVEASRSRYSKRSRSRYSKRSRSRSVGRSKRSRSVGRSNISRSLRRSSRSRSVKRSKRSRSLKRSKRSRSFRHSRSQSLKSGRSRSLRSNGCSKSLYDKNKSNFSSNSFDDNSNTQKSNLHSENSEQYPEYCMKLLTNDYVSKASSISHNSPGLQALEVDDTKLRNQLGAELFVKYKEALLELQRSFEEEFSVYKHIPEFHPNYESHYSYFLSKQNGNESDEELEKLFKLHWKSNYESIKNSDWNDKHQNLIEIIASKVISKPQNEHQQVMGAMNVNYFNFEQGLSLLESVSDKINILGSAVKEMVAASRAFGINSIESYKVFTESDNVAMLHLVSQKVNDLRKVAIDNASRTIYESVLDSIPRLLDEAKKWSNSNSNIDSDQKAMIDAIDVEALAKVSAGKGSDFTVDIINAALSYEGIQNPPTNIVNSIFVKVCNIHFSMSNNK